MQISMGNCSEYIPWRVLLGRKTQRFHVNFVLPHNQIKQIKQQACDVSMPMGDEYNETKRNCKDRSIVIQKISDCKFKSSDLITIVSYGRTQTAQYYDHVNFY